MGVQGEGPGGDPEGSQGVLEGIQGGPKGRVQTLRRRKDAYVDVRMLKFQEGVQEVPGEVWAGPAGCPGEEPGGVQGGSLKSSSARLRFQVRV